MICQNCQANVDNDLVFCTSCGTRLTETLNQLPTVSINESVVTKTSVPKVEKPASNLKWIALIIALISIPMSLFAAYLIYSNLKQPQIIANNNTAKPQSTPKTSTNRQNTNSNIENTNANNLVNTANSNISNTNANAVNDETLDEKWINEEAPEDKRTEVWGEQIEIAPETHYAVQFSAEDKDKIVANIKTLNGSNIEGFVFTQAAFDEHFPDPTYKAFSFGGEKNIKIEQYLVKENYVMVFINKNKTPTTIIGKAFTVRE